MRGISAIDGMELGSCRRAKKPPLPTQDAAYLLRLAKKVLHRTQTDVTFEEYFIMFHCQRELIIKDNVYEFDFFLQIVRKTVRK